METVEVSVNSSHGGSLQAGYHWCRCCKVHVVKDDYNLCYGCEKKWWKVYNDCVNHGWAEDMARQRANDAYPGREYSANCS